LPSETARATSEVQINPNDWKPGPGLMNVRIRGFSFLVSGGSETNFNVVDGFPIHGRVSNAIILMKSKKFQNLERCLLRPHFNGSRAANG